MRGLRRAGPLNNGHASGARSGVLRHSPCILCGHMAFRVIHLRDSWAYLRCRQCGLVVIFPKPGFHQSMSDYADYLPEEPGEISKWRRMMGPVIEESIRIIESRHGGRTGKILDVGCGFGFFLKEMRDKGWDVEGVEISHTGKDYAGNKWNLPVHMGPLEEIGLPERTFDVVTLFYVIEHVLDPIGLLREVLRILKPGGMVLVRWPHTTPIVTAMGWFSRWLDLYHTPYHIYDFSPRTITSLLVSCGFINCSTVIGGHTRPEAILTRPLSSLTCGLARSIFKLSSGKILLPGVSKTTLALKKGA